jgi:hypothetical protein
MQTTIAEVEIVEGGIEIEELTQAAAAFTYRPDWVTEG